MFDDRSVGSDVDDSVAANVIESVIANQHAEAGIPLGSNPVGRPAKYSAAIHVPDLISFDAQVDKAAGLRIADRAVVNAAVDLVFEDAVYVVNFQVL